MNELKNLSALVNSGAKFPAFMIAENPMSKNKGEFILYTRPPQMLLQVFDLTKSTKAEKEYLFTSTTNGGLTEVLSQTFAVVPVQVYDENYTFTDANEIAKLMRRAADWWHSYMIFENDLINSEA